MLLATPPRDKRYFAQRAKWDAEFYVRDIPDSEIESIDRYQFGADDGHIIEPARDEPGTLGEQFRAIVTALYLAERRKSTAEAEWNDARSLTVPHARRGDR